MKRKIGWYKTFQALSLDVVLGAIVFSIAIGTYYRVFIPWNVFSCLSIAIWIIYTCDHLLDARKICGEASTYRHQFHKRHYKKLIIAIIIASILCIINIYYLPKPLLFIGAVGGFFTFIYFILLQRTSLWAKEIYVALIYSFGVFIGPVYYAYYNMYFIQWCLILQVFLLVLSNLLLFSWYDFLKDKQDGHTSMIIRLGKKYSETLIKTILLTGTLWSVIILFSKINRSTIIMQLVILFMYCILTLLYKQHQLFRQNDSYRIIGDGMFFIPLIYLLYEGLRQF